MNAVIRPLRSADEPAAARLLNDTVGPGFWDFDHADWTLSFVAMTAGAWPVSSSPAWRRRRTSRSPARPFVKRLPPRI